MFNSGKTNADKFIPRVPRKMHVGAMIGRLRDSAERKEVAA